jgi:hypothetical protein
MVPGGVRARGHSPGLCLGALVSLGFVSPRQLRHGHVILLRMLLTDHRYDQA